jgi:hypothetical protein
MNMYRQWRKPEKTTFYVNVGFNSSIMQVMDIGDAQMFVGHAVA